MPSPPPTFLDEQVKGRGGLSMKSPVYIVHEIYILSVHIADNQLCYDDCLLYIIWFFDSGNVTDSVNSAQTQFGNAVSEDHVQVNAREGRLGQCILVVVHLTYFVIVHRTKI